MSEAAAILLLPLKQKSLENVMLSRLFCFLYGF